MARNLTSIPDIIPADADYPNGRIQNAVPPDPGTPVIEELYGDIIQFFHKLMRTAGISHNGLPENETQGFQFVEALAYYVRTLAASDSQKGTTEYATNAETQAGASAALSVTPAGLESKTATDSRKGIAELANQTEAREGLDSTRIMTASRILDALRNGTVFLAQTSYPGVVEKATTVEAAAGTSDKYIDANLMQTSNGKAWQTPILNSGFSFASSNPLRYRINRGKLELRGGIDSTVATNAIAFSLPSGYIPLITSITNVSQEISTGDGNSSLGSVYSNGDVRCHNWSINGTNYFNAIIIID